MTLEEKLFILLGADWMEKCKNGMMTSNITMPEQESGGEQVPPKQS